MHQNTTPLSRSHRGMQCSKHTTACDEAIQHRCHNTDDHAQHVAVTFFVFQHRSATLTVDPVVCLLHPQAVVDRESHRSKVRWQLDGFAAV